ncbi:E3 ubiquitin-protein ligase RNF8-A, partial [Dufourea novaeangliae]
MEGSKVEKRGTLDDSDAKPLEPILVRLDERGCAAHYIFIDKNEFKIGRARDNDEIILDTMISRRHCLLRCEGNDEWTIKDSSSSATFVNDIPLTFGITQRISDGDIIQFSTCDQFKYRFTLVAKEECKTKKPRLDEQILDNVLTEQKTFAESQEFAGPSVTNTDSCIFLELLNDPSGIRILDTIDLTLPTQIDVGTEEKESIMDKVTDIMDEQLTCSVCSELFVKATTLSCMHTFCQHCIRLWSKKKRECPVCRASVTHMNRSLVLDNFIES